MASKVGYGDSNVPCRASRAAGDEKVVYMVIVTWVVSSAAIVRNKYPRVGIQSYEYT